MHFHLIFKDSEWNYVAQLPWLRLIHMSWFWRCAAVADSCGAIIWYFSNSSHLIIPPQMHASNAARVNDPLTRWMCDLLCCNLLSFFFYWPIPASFCLFSFFSHSNSNSNDKYKLKKHRWCAWDSNPGRQDGRRRRIHWAIAAPLSFIFLQDTFHVLFTGSSDKRLTYRIWFAQARAVASWADRSMSTPEVRSSNAIYSIFNKNYYFQLLTSNKRRKFKKKD